MALKKNDRKQNPKKQYRPKKYEQRAKKPVAWGLALSINGSKYVGLYHFSCGNEVPIYEVHTVHALNQLVGHAKINNQAYGNVYYRGECELHPSLKPSLFRKVHNVENQQIDYLD